MRCAMDVAFMVMGTVPGSPMMRARVNAPGPGTPEPRRVSRSARPRTRSKGKRARTSREIGKGISRSGGTGVGVAVSDAGSGTAKTEHSNTGSGLAPEKWPALVLNADYMPLSLVPLSLWPWQEVMKAVCLGRVNVVETYDIEIRSPSARYPLPSVVSLKRYQPPARRAAAFTRFNLFLRDNFECQYCGKSCATRELTFDHVVPRCRGGKTSWENVVAACEACNHSKGRKMLQELDGRFKLRNKPEAPSMYKLQSNARKFPPRRLHESWRDYVYWSLPMENEGADQGAEFNDRIAGNIDVGDTAKFEDERWP